MDKWNQQAAPNNNSRPSDMEWSVEGSPKTAQNKVGGEELNNKKIENELKRAEFLRGF